MTLVLPLSLIVRFSPVPPIQSGSTDVVHIQGSEFCEGLRPFQMYEIIYQFVYSVPELYTVHLETTK